MIVKDDSRIAIDGGRTGRSWARKFFAFAKLMKPSTLKVVTRDITRSSYCIRSTRDHLDETMAWLARAQDFGSGGGISGGYSLIQGWLPPYPETTGYIIPTFFDYNSLVGRQELVTRAVRMADWELSVQLSCGAVQAGVYRGAGTDRRPAVFNTGQVILGWCRAYSETKNNSYLQAAMKAGDWLISVQTSEGSWRQAAPETETDVHAYDVRTAWSLLELHLLVGDKRYSDAGQRNLDWSLSLQRGNGWFEHNAFFISRERWRYPFTHTIAYVMEGFQEAERITGDKRYGQALGKVAEKLLEITERSPFLQGHFDSDWGSLASYCCLTGSAQIAGVFLRLFLQTNDVRYKRAGLALNNFVKGTQDLRSTQLGIRGGVKGSWPIYGRYTPFIYVNWAAKFFADSLMLEEKINRRK
jgi:hypothetical protein